MGREKHNQNKLSDSKGKSVKTQFKLDERVVNQWC